jgi:hypothetical protein
LRVDVLSRALLGVNELLDMRHATLSECPLTHERGHRAIRRAGLEKEKPRRPQLLAPPVFTIPPYPDEDQQRDAE